MQNTKPPTQENLAQYLQCFRPKIGGNGIVCWAQIALAGVAAGALVANEGRGRRCSHAEEAAEEEEDEDAGSGGWNWRLPLVRNLGGNHWLCN